MKNSEKKPKSASWQERFLIITGILELIILIPCIFLTVILGMKGYAVGEMGMMIGFFSTAVLLLLLPYTVVRALSVHGLRKRKRSAAIATIVLSLLLTAAVCFGIRDCPVFTLAVILYAGCSVWSAVTCLRGSCFEKPTQM